MGLLLIVGEAAAAGDLNALSSAAPQADGGATEAG